MIGGMRDIMDVVNEKEVRFDIWCPKCVHHDEPETEDPCDECMNEPSNWGSTKPYLYKPKDSSEDRSNEKLRKKIRELTSRE